MYPYFHLFSAYIPSYGVFMACGICFASIMAIYRVKKAGGDLDYTLVILCCAFCGAFLGGHLLYLMVSYGLNHVLEDIKTGNFAFVKSTGLVFYGGLIGGIAGAFTGIRITHETRYSMLVNALVPCIPFGHAIGRIGCLFAGCCYGIAYNGFGAINLSSVGISYSVFPVQLLEAILNMVLFIGLSMYSRKRTVGFMLFYIYLIYYSMIRFLLEFLRGDIIRGIYLGLSSSQWISLCLFFISLIFLFFSCISKRSGKSRSSILSPLLGKLPAEPNHEACAADRKNDPHQPATADAKQVSDQSAHETTDNAEDNVLKRVARIRFHDRIRRVAADSTDNDFNNQSD
ncbi:MAG: prolipoprotein diacylglyceryl transferase [Firmicutes bacterium]|nr:prolipoprotein diacylglyceryl transferase [Bacillota bacterium]